MRPKIYSCYSESHLPLLYRHFLPSVPAWVDLVLRKIPQSCPTGNYRQAGWTTTMQAKVNMILDALMVEKNPFIVSDVDVRFYNFVPSDLVFKSQIACQKNDTLYGAGFMIIKPGHVTQTLFSKTLLAIPKHNSEEAALNFDGIPSMKGVTGLVEVLPERFWNCKTALKPDTVIPADLAMHHGNWVVGVENKLALLDEVFRRRTSGIPA